MIDRLTALFSVLRALWPMSLTAAFAALVVILLRLALRKRAPRQIVCLMWLIVFARLLFPFNLESHVSVMPAALAEPPAAVQVSADLPGTVTFPVQEQTPAQAVQPGLVHTAVQEPAAVTPPVIQAPEGHAPSVPDSTPSDDFNADSTPAAFPWQALLAGVWLAGVLAMLGYALISYLRLRRSVFAAVRAADGAWEHPHVYSPFILGFFRPKIYLPAGVTGPARQLILCHERAHLRRRDYIVKPICWLALALHWFNPLVWASYLLMSRDIEVACDQAVIRQLGPGVKADYSSALLALATNGRFPAPCPLAFGLGGVGSRIRNILSYRKPAAWIGVMSALAAILAAVCLLTDPIAQASSPPEDPDVPWHTLAVSPLGQPENGVYTQFTLTYGNQEHTFSGAHCEGLEIGSYVEDLNGDGAPELIVSLTSGYGDGFLTSNLHVFDSETFEQYNCADLVTLIDSSLTYSADSEAYYLSAPNFEQTVRKDSFPEYIAQEDLLYFISIGDYYSFSAADGVLYCTLGCKVTSSVSCGNLTVGLVLTGDGFQCIYYSFAFNEALSNYRPVDRSTLTLVQSSSETDAALYTDPNGEFVLCKGDWISYLEIATPTNYDRIILYDSDPDDANVTICFYFGNSPFPFTLYWDEAERMWSTNSGKLNLSGLTLIDSLSYPRYFYDRDTFLYRDASLRCFLLDGGRLYDLGYLGDSITDFRAHDIDGDTIEEITITSYFIVDGSLFSALYILERAGEGWEVHQLQTHAPDYQPPYSPGDVSSAASFDASGTSVTMHLAGFDYQFTVSDEIANSSGSYYATDANSSRSLIWGGLAGNPYLRLTGAIYRGDSYCGSYELLCWPQYRANGTFVQIPVGLCAGQDDQAFYLPSYMAPEEYFGLQECNLTVAALCVEECAYTGATLYQDADGVSILRADGHIGPLPPKYQGYYYYDFRADDIAQLISNPEDAYPGINMQYEVRDGDLFWYQHVNLTWSDEEGIWIGRDLYLP